MALFFVSVAGVKTSPITTTRTSIVPRSGSGHSMIKTVTANSTLSAKDQKVNTERERERERERDYRKTTISLLINQTEINFILFLW